MIVVLSVAELFAAAGSLTPLGVVIVTVLLRVPDAWETVPLTVNVTDPPAGMSTGVLMLPFPLAGQLALPLAEHVHVTPLRPLGMMSETNAPVTDTGPELLAMIV